jgi:hypothetical protein
LGFIRRCQELSVVVIPVEGTRANQWAILIAQESGDADGDGKAPTGDAYSSDDVEHTPQIAMAMTSLTG